MSDPLSIAASVTALISVTGTVYTLLSGFLSSIADAPDSARNAFAAVEEMRMALVSVKQVIDRLSVIDPERKEMVHVRHLVVTFRESILSLSELEAIIRPPIGVLDRFKWRLEEEKIMRALRRIELQKTSLLTIISILQCESTIDAHERAKGLEESVQQILAQNDDLLRQLAQLDFVSGVEDASVRFFDNNDDGQSSIHGQHASGHARAGRRILIMQNLRGFIKPGTSFPSARSLGNFETTLEQSRVYLRAERNDCDISFSSSIPRSNAWSMLSGLSLNDVSVVSVIALPITLEEINGVGADLTFAKILSGAIATETITETNDPQDSSSRSGQISIRMRPYDWRIPDLQVQRRAPVPPSSTPVSEAQLEMIGGRHVMILYKLIVLGDSGVGKSELANQIRLAKYDPINEDFFRKQTVIDGQLCILEVLDNAGMEGYTALHDQFIHHGEGFVLVYSIFSRSSFTHIKRFYRQIQRVKECMELPSYAGSPIAKATSLSVPIMLVGNNCERVTEREISVQEGQALARELGCQFVEASSKNNINAEKAFYDVVREIRRQRRAKD